MGFVAVIKGTVPVTESPLLRAASLGLLKDTAYVIEVRLSGNAPPYTIHRRFKDFHDLNQRFSILYGKDHLVLPFPKTSLTNMFNTVKYRKGALQEFLDAMSANQIIGGHVQLQNLVLKFLARPKQGPAKRESTNQAEKVEPKAVEKAGPGKAAAPANESAAAVRHTSAPPSEATSTPAVESAGITQPHPPAVQSAKPAATEAAAGVQWQCTACTLLNSGEESQCSVCQTPRPGYTAPKVAETEKKKEPKVVQPVPNGAQSQAVGSQSVTEAGHDQVAAAGHGQASSGMPPPQKTDFFLSHTQRNGDATTMATELYGSLKEQGLSVWFDVKMADRSSAAMKQGVENAQCVIAIITGPCDNPDCPDDPPDSNAYFARPYCVSELRWAKEAGVKIQPVIRAADKTKIGELLGQAPDDLKCLGDTDFITLDRSDKDYWGVGIKKILRAIGKTPVDTAARQPPPTAAPPAAPPVAVSPPIGYGVPQYGNPQFGGPQFIPPQPQYGAPQYGAPPMPYGGYAQPGYGGPQAVSPYSTMVQPVYTPAPAPAPQIHRSHSAIRRQHTGHSNHHRARGFSHRSSFGGPSTSDIMCSNCSGMGGFDTWGGPCETSSFMCKETCVACGGSGEVPASSRRCQKCDGMGNLDAWGNGCTADDVTRRGFCDVCCGRGIET